MKYMTNAQIDELNLLLDKHGAALTAFYNEGMRQGSQKCDPWYDDWRGDYCWRSDHKGNHQSTQAKELNKNWGRLISGSFSFCPLRRPL